MISETIIFLAVAYMTFFTFVAWHSSSISFANRLTVKALLIFYRNLGFTLNI